MTHYEFHELAKIFPMLEGDELEALRADIEANGQINRIILYQGKILDGRNRYRICEMLGIEPETIVYSGDDPIGLVLSLNIHRRHLDASQRSMVAAKLSTLQQGRPAGENKPANLPVYPQDAENKDAVAQVGTISQPEAAKMLNVSERQVRNAAQLRREAPSEIIEQVERGEKTVHAALKEIGQSVPGKDGKIRPVKYKPRKKTVAKTEVPEKQMGVPDEEKPDDEIIDLETRIANAYEMCVGKTPEKFLKIPYPHCYAAESKILCVCYGDASNELQRRLAEETEKLGEALYDLTHPE